jgi:hypothetical protein
MGSVAKSYMRKGFLIHEHRTYVDVVTISHPLPRDPSVTQRKSEREDSVS